jgi:hypothetical protein
MFTLLHGQTALVVGFIAAYFIPYVTAFVHREHWPSIVMGVITTVLSVADGFFSTWAASSNVSHYDWKTAVSASFAAFVMAFFSHKTVLKGTELEDSLLAVGSKPKAAPAPPAV